MSFINRNVKFYDEYNRLRTDASDVIRKLSTGEDITVNEEIVKQSRELTYFGETAYIVNVTDGDLSYLILACPAYKDTLYLMYDRLDGVTQEQYIDDIICILTDTKPESSIHAAVPITAGALFVLAAGAYVFLRRRERKAASGTDTEELKDGSRE